jgi:hypothetical protein
MQVELNIERYLLIVPEVGNGMPFDWQVLRQANTTIKISLPKAKFKR